MHHLKMITTSLVAIALIACAGSTIHAETLTVAVASNFAETLERIVIGFEAEQSHKVVLVRGSSGNHYAQIIHGAPFDLFFSADRTRPQALVAEGRVASEQVADYAVGQLVLWAPSANSSTPARAILIAQNFRRLAMANPKLAPYGKAAVDVLDALGITLNLENGRIVRGENVAQAYQFVATGNVALGFVALSQVTKLPPQEYWLVPQDYYQPIVQQYAILKASKALSAFVDYFWGLQAQSILLNHGYQAPPNE